LSETQPDYEVVIGLEVHCQLRTRSKLFSSAAVSYGEPPNHHTTPVCLALPGALPVLNGTAVELAVSAGLAANCTIQTHSVFARKNYFYPDLPKGYQISQWEEPLCLAGWLDIQVGEAEPRRIGITRIHMEEDAGKSLHDGSATETHVDLNRAGIPLVEIVSEPDLRSPEEAGAYLRKLRGILRTIGASDADMEKGQLRCDANISLRRHGEKKLGTRTELKNLNSFRFVERALHAEIERQAALLDEGGEIQQATLGYDSLRDRSFVMRTKENADDYRYFPDPDLIPLVISQERIEAIRASLPELPEARCLRFQQEYGLQAREAQLLSESRSLGDLFEAAAKVAGGSDTAGSTAKTIAKWLLREVLAALKERDATLEDARIEPQALAGLVAMVEAGRVTASNARSLLPELLFEGGDPAALVRARGLEALSDKASLEPIVDAVIAGNAKAVAAYAGGDRKSLNFLMGQVMKQSQGKADPAKVREILARKLGG